MPGRYPLHQRKCPSAVIIIITYSKFLAAPLATSPERPYFSDFTPKPAATTRTMILRQISLDIAKTMSHYRARYYDDFDIIYDILTMTSMAT